MKGIWKDVILNREIKGGPDEVSISRDGRIVCDWRMFNFVQSVICVVEKEKKKRAPELRVHLNADVWMRFTFARIPLRGGCITTASLHLTKLCV